jgi:polysaccharide biosynthesis/export protein
MDRANGRTVCSSLICALSLALSLALLSGVTDAQSRATKLLALKLVPNEQGLLAIVQADGPMEHRVVQEQNPEQRLILDILGVQNPLRHYYPPESHPFLERVLMYEYPPSTNPAQTGPLARIVFELKPNVSYRVEPRGNDLLVQFSTTGVAVPASVDDGHVERDAGRGTDPNLDVHPDAAVPGAQASPNATGAETATEVYDPLVPPNVVTEPPDVPTTFFFRASNDAVEDYKLGAEDVVEIRVFELDQLNRTVRVSNDGNIELPLVGSLKVNGLTTNQVADQIANRLRDRYVQNPQVSIFITQFNSQKVSLLGAVATPASYPLSGQRRLLQVLADAGSLSPEAGRTLYVCRQTEDGRSARLTVPLNELLLQGDPRWNILLRAGDVISVPPEQAIAVSILGAVGSPGVHKLPVGADATLLKAIALAGGLNDRASKKGIQIKRRENDGTEIVIQVNLGDILSGKKPDVILLEGDVVVVKESFF